MDDKNLPNDDLHTNDRVIRQTVVHIHTLAIEQGRRIREIERHVRDIKYVVVVLLVVLGLLSYHLTR